MALPNPMESFIWGAGGAKMTPEEVAREREIAAALLKTDFSPVGHWTQGAGRVVDALSGVLKERRAGAAETANTDANSRIVQSLLGGASSFPAAPGAPADTSVERMPLAPVDEMATAGVPDQASQRVAQAHGMGPTIKQGLISRGLPEHVADAFVMNFQDESGLNPGINEAAPTVPGSRGGFGLAQWTGPRRRQLEAFAAQNGAPVDDPDVQLDFLMTELQGPESAAAKKILGAPDTGSAAAAIVNSFLRPAEQHRTSREARYLKAGGQQVASLDPSVGLPQQQPSPASQAISQALGSGGAPAAPQMAQAAPMPEMAGNAPAPASNVQAAIMEALSNPAASDQTRKIASMLLGQQMEQNDPMRQLDMDYKRAQLDALTNKQQQPQPLMNAGSGSIYNPNTGEWLTAPNQGQQAELPSRVREYEYAKQQGFPGSFNDWLASQKGGMSLQVDPATGQVSFQQGANIKPLTEGQSKDTTFAVRAEGSLPILDKFGSALTSLPQSSANALPGGVGNYMQSPEFQQAQQAGTEFLQAILRKDTGAAITPQETAEYGKVYLPRPGDSPEVLEQKQLSRSRALEALKAGMTPQAILAQESALKRVGSAPKAPVVIDGYTIEQVD